MPTIEIIAIDCPAVPNFPRFKGLAYIAEDKLVSHRGLFRTELNKHTGVIVHLAGKDFTEKNGFWFAGNLMHWDLGHTLQFLREPARDVRRLLALMLKASPSGRGIFLSDYQFGPSRKKMERRMVTQDRFWAMHDAGKLRYNALYQIRDDRRTRS